jgi:hypothetical protein
MELRMATQDMPNADRRVTLPPGLG